jgi:hypothetical protein
MVSLDIVSTGRGRTNDGGAGGGWISASGEDAIGVFNALKNGDRVSKWNIFAVHDILLELLCGVLGMSKAPGECTARPTSKDVNAGPDKEELDVLDKAGLLPLDTDNWTEWTMELVMLIPDSFTFSPGCAKAMHGVLSDINVKAPPAGRSRAAVRVADAEVQTTTTAAPTKKRAMVSPPPVQRSSKRLSAKRAAAAAKK